MTSRKAGATSPLVIATWSLVIPTLLNHLHLRPLAAVDRLVDRLQHRHALGPVLEARRTRLVVRDALHQVDRGVREGVVVAHHVARRPPGPGVGMDAFGRDDPPEALPVARIFRRVVVEIVEVLKTPDERSLAAVQLEPIVVL